LPQGLSRFNPAGLAENWQYEGTAFLAQKEASPGNESVPVLRLHHSAKGYIFTISEVEASAAERAGYVREGTAFFAPVKGGVPVLRFRIPRSDSHFYTTSRQEGTAARFVYEGVAFHAYDSASGDNMAPNRKFEAASTVIPVARYRDTLSGVYLLTAGHESPYQVGAFYFGSFASSATNIISGTEKVYGRKGDWWGGVKDFYGAEPGVPVNHRGWPGEWPDLKPQIGYYDQASVETLEQHITQAADAGLTFFSFYWFWDNQKHSEMGPESISSYLRARNVKRLKFNFTLYAHPWDDDMAITPQNAEEVAQRLVGFFSHPQYLRLPDGRPVFSIGDDRNVRDSKGAKCTEMTCYENALSAFLAVLNRISMDKLGVAPFVQVQVGVPGWDRQPGVDGLTCFGGPPLEITGGSPYPEFSEDQFARFTGPYRPFSPCMMENFDERPRQDVLISDRNAIRYLVGKTDALFRHNLKVVRDVSDQNFQVLKSPASRIIYLYAWNEWHEGGILEPNAHSDAHDLNIVTDVFQLPRSPSACLDQGKCTETR